MVDTNALRKIMVDRNNMPISSLASQIGRSPATVGRWFDSCAMPTVYAEAIAEVLCIPQEERLAIFFNGMFPVMLQVAQQATPAPKTRHS